MDAAFWDGGEALRTLLPDGVAWISRPEELTHRRWALLTLTERGCAYLEEARVACGCEVLLLPQEWSGLALTQVRSERVVSYGLSPRDSLTLSSMGEQAVLCVQRTLLRPDGGSVEVQELPLPALDLTPGELLAVFGTRLLLE
ncbi:MAG: hypothetical protein LKJ80_06990 [Oscillibacter sp.]|jgi:hypothetical protein|nr:hypothetical protein [Oscillibacter sp.]